MVLEALALKALLRRPGGSTW